MEFNSFPAHAPRKAKKPPSNEKSIIFDQSRTKETPTARNIEAIYKRDLDGQSRRTSQVGQQEHKQETQPVDFEAERTYG